MNLETSGESWKRHDEDAADLLDEIGISTGHQDLVDLTVDEIEEHVDELPHKWEVN